MTPAIPSGGDHLLRRPHGASKTDAPGHSRASSAEPCETVSCVSAVAGSHHPDAPSTPPGQQAHSLPRSSEKHPAVNQIRERDISCSLSTDIVTPHGSPDREPTAHISVTYETDAGFRLAGGRAGGGGDDGETTQPPPYSMIVFPD